VYLIRHAQLGDPHLDGFSSRADNPRNDGVHLGRIGNYMTLTTIPGMH